MGIKMPPRLLRVAVGGDNGEGDSAKCLFDCGACDTISLIEG